MWWSGAFSRQTFIWSIIEPERRPRMPSPGHNLLPLLHINTQYGIPADIYTDSASIYMFAASEHNEKV